MKQLIAKTIKKLGYRLEKDRRLSHEYARKIFRNKPIMAMEIGVWEGDHALRMLKDFNIKKLYLIDPYLDYDGFDIDGSVARAKKIAERKLAPYKHKIVWIKETSEYARKMLGAPWKGKFDYIYIDANHKYDFVKWDMDNWFPLVKKGGIFSGHDITGLEHRDVAIAYFDFCKENKIKPLILAPDWIILKE